MPHDNRSSDRPRPQGRNRNRNRQRHRDGDRNRGGNHDDRFERRHRSPRVDDSIEYIPGREIREERDRDNLRRRSGSGVEAKPSLGARILKIISFGLLGRKKQEGKVPPRPQGQKPPPGRPPAGKNAGAKTPSGPKPASRPPSEPRQKSEPRPMAPLDPASIASPRLHVGNLSYDTVESDLFELFKGFGRVTNVEIVTHQRTQRSKGFGFVQMATLEDARRAAGELHGKEFMGRPMTVGAAKAAPPRADRNQDDSPQSPKDQPPEDAS